MSWHHGNVAPRNRADLLRQHPLTVWLTGLSGAGKSTLAYALEASLLEAKYASVVLDGDNIRHGLCRDLGFCHDDRSENIRRVAEVARLMNDAGLIVISAFISPYRADRELAKSVICKERFVEVFLSASLDACERRDPKGLYRSARAGKISCFTGISDVYEIPDSPNLSIDTAEVTVAESTEQVMRYLSPMLMDAVR